MWSEGFLRELESRNLRPRFLLESVGDSELGPDAGLMLSSHTMPGYVRAIGLIGARVSASQVQLGEWTSSTSELTLGFRVAAIDVRRRVTRGQLLRLRVGFSGWSESDYQTVYRGFAQGIDRSGDDWTLTIRSVVAALVSRMGVDLGPVLFDNLGSSTLTVGYTPGAGTVAVASNVTAERPSSVGADFLLQIFPDSGDPFFLTATGLSSTTGFTGVSSTGVLGTDEEAASAGAEVIYCAYIEANPVRAARSILVSTGNGAHGVFDVLPDTWGVGLPTELLDEDDLDRSASLVNPAGVVSPLWRIYSTESQEDGLSWLQDLLSPGGMVLCERQGLLTIRAVFPADEPQYEIESVTDRDLISISRQQSWDSGSPIEYAYLAAVEPGGFSLPGGEPVPTSLFGEEVESRPAGVAKYLDLRYLDADATDWCDDIVARLGPWVTRVPEVLELVCAGLRLAKLAPCDTVELDSRHVTTRDGEERARWLVLLVEPDWWQGTVRLLVARTPADELEF